MRNNHKVLSLSAVIALTTGSQAMAAGFQLAEYSVTGLGRAYAGEAALADNAGAQFRNPAALSQLKGTQISAGSIYVDPNIEVEGDVTFGGPAVSTTAEDIAHDAVIPNFYLSHSLNDEWSLGLAVATNYGMESELEGDYLATHFGNQGKILSVEINPNVAYQLNDDVAVGAGIRYVLGEGHFGAALPPSMGGTDLKYMEGEDEAFGWQAGATWQVTPASRVAIAYRSAVDFTLDGEASGLAYGGQTLGGKMDLTLPASLEIASNHQLNAEWVLHFSANWTDWSSFEKLEADIEGFAQPDLIKEENWEDNYRLAAGTSYQYSDTVTLRAGLAYDTSAVSDEYRTPTIPETDRIWTSFGAAVQVSPQLTVDGGFTYIFAEDATISEEVILPAGNSFIVSTLEAEMNGSVWLAGLQASYRF